MLQPRYQRLNTEIDNPDPIEKWAQQGARVIFILDEDTRSPSQAIIPTNKLNPDNAHHAYCLGYDESGPLLLLLEKEISIEKELIDQNLINGIRDLSHNSEINIAPLLHAHGLANWHLSHQYCSNCGTKTELHHGGLCQKCPNCQRIHFPRTDPCVIVRVERQDSICLGGQAVWPKKQRSVLAGFIETGESAEQCVVREIKEESNLDVDNIQYLTSQSWPFPRSLMLAFSAQNKSGDFHSLNDEILDLKWYDADELYHSVKNNKIRLPAVKSVAYWLIEDWYQTQTGSHLASIT